MKALNKVNFQIVKGFPEPQESCIVLFFEEYVFISTFYNLQGVSKLMIGTENIFKIKQRLLLTEKNIEFSPLEMLK